MQLESKKKQILQRPQKEQTLQESAKDKGTSENEWGKDLLLLIPVVLWGRQTGLHQGYLLFLMEITWQIPQYQLLTQKGISIIRTVSWENGQGLY